MGNMETHGENLERVSVRIAWAVEEFFRQQLCRAGSLRLFHAQELRNHVIRMTGINAPASADRVMRDLRNPQARLDYKVVSRRESLYEPIWVRPRPGESSESKPVEPKDGGSLMPSEVTTVQLALAECEARIEQHLKTAKQSYREIGRELALIRSNQLYEVTHKTFEDYCRERWGFNRVHAYRQIGAARFADGMLSTDNIPENERQVRPLEALPPAMRQEVWNEAVRASPNGRVTAKLVREQVETHLGKRPVGRPRSKKAKEAEGEYIRWLFKEFMHRRKEADLANSRRSWNPDAISKVALIKIMIWVETELRTYIDGHSANARRAKKSPQLGNGADDDYENQIRSGSADARTGAAI